MRAQWIGTSPPRAAATVRSATACHTRSLPFFNVFSSHPPHLTPPYPHPPPPCRGACCTWVSLEKSPSRRFAIAFSRLQPNWSVPMKSGPKEGRKKAANKIYRVDCMSKASYDGLRAPPARHFYLSHFHSFLAYSFRYYGQFTDSSLRDMKCIYQEGVPAHPLLLQLYCWEREKKRMCLCRQCDYLVPGMTFA